MSNVVERRRRKGIEPEQRAQQRLGVEPIEKPLEHSGREAIRQPVPTTSPRANNSEHRARCRRKQVSEFRTTPQPRSRQRGLDPRLKRWASGRVRRWVLQRCSDEPARREKSNVSRHGVMSESG